MMKQKRSVAVVYAACKNCSNFTPEPFLRKFNTTIKGDNTEREIQMGTCALATMSSLRVNAELGVCPRYERRE